MKVSRVAALAATTVVLAAGTAWITLQHEPWSQLAPEAPPREAADEATAVGAQANTATGAPVRPSPRLRRRLEDGLVIGKIVDPWGGPVEGANIYLVGARADATPFARPPRDLLHHARQRALEGANFKYKDLRTLRSREDGSFVFVGREVPDADRVELHVLFASGGLPLLEPEPIELDELQRDGQPLVMTCRQGATVDLSCRLLGILGSGERVQLTLACARADGTGYEFKDSVSLGMRPAGMQIFGLPSGTYSVWVQGDHGIATAPPFHLVDGGPTRRVDLDTGRASLVVRVVGEDGRPFGPGAVVTVASAFAEGAGSAQADAVPYEITRTVTRYENCARFAGLPEGEVQVEVVPALGPRAARTVRLVRGGQEERFTLSQAPPKPCVITGTVQGLEGGPLSARLRIHEGTTSGHMYPVLLRECCTDGGGRFLAEDLPERTLLVLVSAQGRQSKLVRLEPKKQRATEVNWILVPLTEGAPAAAVDPDAASGPTGAAAARIVEPLGKPAQAQQALPVRREPRKRGTSDRPPADGGKTP